MSFDGLFGGGPDLTAAPPPTDTEPDTRASAVAALEKERRRVGLEDLRSLSPTPPTGTVDSLGVPR